jgi:hypothetical protein
LKEDNARPTQSTESHVIAWQSLKCKGHSPNWLAAVPILIAVRHELSLDLPFAGRLMPPMSDRAVSLSDQPNVPPPETA